MILQKTVRQFRGLVRTQVAKRCKCSLSSEELIEKERKYSAQNYEPIGVVITRGKGCEVWDPEGKRYLDFLAGYAAVNTGHCHPKILDALIKQAGTLHHTSRAFYNSVFPRYAEYVTKLLNYDKVLPMNTGVEGGETAIKIARRWGYKVKQIKRDSAKVIFARQNFWGRTLAAVSSSTNPSMYESFGPYMPGFVIIPYNDVQALEEALSDPSVCAYMCEPIQGEAGVVVPDEGYLKEVRRLCSMNNVLWIADEVQTGIGRTGKMLACEHECVQPDLTIIGKGLGGGFLPVSAVLGKEKTMGLMTPGTHGSTFGGMPLACQVAMTTLQVIQEEKLVENAKVKGEKFRQELCRSLKPSVATDIRGKGLMNAIAINDDVCSALEVCHRLKDRGLLSKPCDGNVLRFTPPLTLNDKELEEGLSIICKTFEELS